MTSSFRSRHTYMNASRTSVESYYRRPRPHCADQGLFVIAYFPVIYLIFLCVVIQYIKKQLFWVVSCKVFFNCWNIFWNISVLSMNASSYTVFILVVFWSIVWSMFFGLVWKVSKFVKAWTCTGKTNEGWSLQFSWRQSSGIFSAVGRKLPFAKLENLVIKGNKKRNKAGLSILKLCSFVSFKVFWFMTPCGLVYSSQCLERAFSLLDSPEDGGCKLLWIIGNFIQIYGVPYPRSLGSARAGLWEPRILCLPLFACVHGTSMFLF